PTRTTAVLRIDKWPGSYRGVKAIDGLSLQAPAGQMTCIVGPNGSGKSTTLKASLGLVQASHGTVKFFDKPVAKVRNRIAYVPQRSTTDWDFPINVFDTVLLGTFPNLGVFERPKARHKDIAHVPLDRVHMAVYTQRQ